MLIDCAWLQISERLKLWGGLGELPLRGVFFLLQMIPPPLRKRKTPEVTTSSPGFRPETIAVRSPLLCPSLTNCSLTPLNVLPSSDFKSDTMNTESPYGA